MIGIRDIGYYIPEARKSNYLAKDKFGIDDDFIREKLGVESVSVKGAQENTSDLCVTAFKNLQERSGVDPGSIQLIAVVTQNPDHNIPHVSAIVHGKLGLPERCASFDISLGCSGYVYGLSITQGFMKENSIRSAVLFTCDPYSMIVDSEDKNTSLIFGDAATATFIGPDPLFTIGSMSYGTIGSSYRDLICVDKRLSMNGRSIFNFASQKIPADIHRLLTQQGLTVHDIDAFILHQGSKFIIDTLIARCTIDAAKAPYDIISYGNTVSSSIPIILAKELHNIGKRRILVSGFGVGLSWASMILERLRQ
jgi:3-oxoacyl-[acyl-carrier-protein] synthase-3